MTDDELKALMRATMTEGYPSDVRRLIEAVQAAERERCAKACEAEAENWRGEQDISDFKLCAARIRSGA